MAELFQLRKNLDLTSFKFKKLNDLVEDIGIPKEKLCTHCWDGSSCFKYNEYPYYQRSLFLGKHKGNHLNNKLF